MLLQSVAKNVFVILPHVKLQPGDGEVQSYGMDTHFQQLLLVRFVSS